MKIAIASTKGGVGKTLVAVNLFYAIKDIIEEACTLVDEHIQVPNIYHYIKELPQAEEVVVNVRIPEIDQNACTFCGRCVHYCAFDSILMIKDAGHIKVLDDYCTSCGACVYACNDNAISERTEALGKVSSYALDKDRFIEGRMYAIRPLASPIIQEVNEHIKDDAISIIDTPPGSSYPFAESVRDADFVVLLAEQGKAGKRNLEANIQLLLNMEKRFGVLINKSGLGDDGLFEYLQEENILVLADIPYNRKYADLHSCGEIIVQQDAHLKQLFVSVFDKIRAGVKEGQA
ncbi:MAG: 4Fe-4S dicluster domain-containing protein [Bacteroidales bacterium]|nr:4Fe-4S dicluster domain-containing protein [Bacteroidales bacterium]